MAATKTLKQFIRGNPEVSDDNKSDIWSDIALVNSAGGVEGGSLSGVKPVSATVALRCELALLCENLL